MTNQVNQAFEDFYNENKHLYTDTSPYGIMLTTFQAATQASEQRITELQAHVNQLRDALEESTEKLYGSEYLVDVKQAEINIKVIDSTPAQSLAEHDNEVIERIATALENADGEFKTLPEYVSLVRALKATP